MFECKKENLLDIYMHRKMLMIKIHISILRNATWEALNSVFTFTLNEKLIFLLFARIYMQKACVNFFILQLIRLVNYETDDYSDCFSNAGKKCFDLMNQADLK